MCGFLGLVNIPEPSHLPSGYLQRGPDATSSLSTSIQGLGPVSIYHSRLLISGSSISGSQPIVSDDCIMLYNGEMFGLPHISSNYSDTDYLFDSISSYLHSDDLSGLIDFINTLNGFFSIALIDIINSRILLVRDRSGQKPLYYSFTPHSKSLVFGSLLSDVYELSPTAGSYKSSSSIPGGGFFLDELNPLENIQQIQPGTLCVLENGTLRTETWIKPHKTYIYNDESFNQYLSRLDGLLHDAVRIRLNNGSCTALSLSGGYDSTLVASYASQITDNLHSFTLSTTDKNYDEAIASRSVASVLNIPISVIHESPPALSEFINLSNVIELPSFNPSFTAYNSFYKAVSSKGHRILLEGHGADELFGGYSANLVSHTRSELHTFSHPLRTIRSYLRTMQKHYGRSTISSLRSLLASSLRSLITSSEPVDGIHSVRLFFDRYSLPTVLRVFDRLTLFNHIEHRSPFLDPRVVTLAQTTPSHILFHGGYPKSPLRHLLASKGLLNNQRKIGFTSSFLLPQGLLPDSIATRQTSNDRYHLWANMFYASKYQ